MNKRFKELAEEAEKYADYHFKGEPFWTEAYEQKFAELIVEECLNLVDRGGEFVSRPKLVERIKEHFGVEE